MGERASAGGSIRQAGSRDVGRDDVPVTSRRAFARFLLAVIMVQSAWILVMPAFRGPDEFDHVFRAEGVSHGAVLPGELHADLGRGEFTPVRRSVLDAATAVCASYKYTLYYNCHSFGQGQGEWTTAASGAGSYNPTYYFVAGPVGRLFTGVRVDYAIRIVTALACAGLLSWSAVLWGRLGRSRWLTLGLLTALTPVLLFSTTVAAPNGVSYAAGLLFWVAALVTLFSPDPPARGTWTALVTGGVLLCNTHTTGPLWVALITVVFAIERPTRLLSLLRDRRGAVASAAIALGAVASVVWTLVSGANITLEPDKTVGDPTIGDFVANHVVWLLQTIAAFPLRNEPAPVVVYALWLVPFALVSVRGVRTGGRTLLALGWIAGSIIVVATVLTLISFQAIGWAWQGRYGLPLVVGLPLVAVVSAAEARLSRQLIQIVVVCMALAMAISVWHVGVGERRFVVPPLANHIPGGALIAAVLAAAGVVGMYRVLATAATKHGGRLSVTRPASFAPNTERPL